VHGVTFDGERVWFATGDDLRAFDPASGAETRRLARRGDAGTAFDGRHLFQLAGDRIDQIEPRTGEIVRSIPAPGDGGRSGLTWAEGSLWMARYRDGTIHRIDPADGRVLATLRSERFVTGVTFAEGELWHGTMEGERSELRRIDRESGDLLEAVEMPPGAVVSGLEHDGLDTFYCGGARSGKIRAVRRPR